MYTAMIFNFVFEKNNDFAHSSITTLTMNGRQTDLRVFKIEQSSSNLRTDSE